MASMTRQAKKNAAIRIAEQLTGEREAGRTEAGRGGRRQDAGRIEAGRGGRRQAAGRIEAGRIEAGRGGRRQAAGQTQAAERALVLVEDQNVGSQIADLRQLLAALEAHQKTLRVDVTDLEKNVRKIFYSVGDVRNEMDVIKDKVDGLQKKAAVVLEEDVLVPVLSVLSVEELVSLFFKETKEAREHDDILKRKMMKVGAISKEIRQMTVGKKITVKTKDEKNMLEINGVFNVVVE